MFWQSVWFTSPAVSRYDHLRKEASDVQPASTAAAVEGWRAAIEASIGTYTRAHYKHGAATVYGGSAPDGQLTIVACIESHQFNPKNFWWVAWRWRRRWQAGGLLVEGEHSGG